MPAYYAGSIGDFLAQEPGAVLGRLQASYATDGFVQQMTSQTRAWESTIALLRALADRPAAKSWAMLLEYPLYRLRKRLDLVVLAGSTIVVVEFKVGRDAGLAADRRQVEEYALDLRDFHAGSRGRLIVPVLCPTSCSSVPDGEIPATDVAPVQVVGPDALCSAIERVSGGEQLDPAEWNAAPYRPVPNVIEAATTIFAGHSVPALLQADADNLQSAARRAVEIIDGARRQRERALIFLTGVPGSGKTLAGLHVVHGAVASGVEAQGDIVYLSGNVPLVTVLREALVEDEVQRSKATGSRVTKDETRRSVRARIQHVNDFLTEGYRREDDPPPHEHAIVFDEAQRAWDAVQGKKKFNRDASEPELLLDLLARHPDWSACVCLIGGGQEINAGENGLLEWHRALEATAGRGTPWHVYAPRDILEGGPSTSGMKLGVLRQDIRLTAEDQLQLNVPMRSYRSPAVSAWVDAVLVGDFDGAAEIATRLAEYPIVVTRSLPAARAWLLERSRGTRRCGLLASSGARRLRAEGLGVSLNAQDGDAIAHWYLREPGDIRSSYALEVTANEYTCQGLELDFAGVCWGGDMIVDREGGGWTHRKLAGSAWSKVTTADGVRFVRNRYRVLLTRAREGMAIFVPPGSPSDRTRPPKTYDDIALALLTAGARPV